MTTDKLLELLFYTLPAIVTGAVAFGFFQMHSKNEQRRWHFILARKNQRHSLPLRLQAYERLALLMERIDPAKLLIRITPISEDKSDYVNYVAAQIEQEYEHNLTQQIYVSDECWGVVTTAKNATIQMLRKNAMSAKASNADQLRETVLKELFDNPAPSAAALAYLKNEVRSLT